jgi:hypothetical protein
MSISVMARLAAVALATPLSVAAFAPAAAGPAAGLPTVTATATDASAAEADAADTGTVVLTRTGTTGAALDVNYTTIPSTADRARDYRHPGIGTPAGGTGITHTVTIPAGASSVALPFVTMQDTLPEQTEQVEVVVSHRPRSYVIGTPDRALVDIVDDETPVPPSAPTGLTATRVSATQVNLAWTDTSTNEAGFTVEQKPAGGPTFTPVAELPLRSVVYSATSVPAGQAMTYKVTAHNASGSATSSVATSAAAPTPTAAGVQHVHVAGEPGRTKGWPTNNGMWNWGDEIVVMYDDNTFRESAFTHAFAFDQPVLNEQARSLDGGLTWTIEREPIVRPGAPGFPTGGNDGPPITDLPAPIDFHHPDFAMQVRFSDKDYGPSYFYYSYDRARTWRGPYRLPMFGYGTVNARNDYVVDGNREMLLFLSGTPDTNDEGKSRPFAVRTIDGGMTWTRVSESGPLSTIQPSTVRVSPTELVTAIRAREGILVRASTNNGASWSARSVVTGGNNTSVNSPGSLLRLSDGRIVIVHGYRIAPFGVRARVSSDNGRTWSDEVVVRQDGGSFDLGYTRAILRPDGKIVAAYYFNADVAEERTIEASIIDPAVVFPTTPPPSSTTPPTTTPPTTAAPATTVPSGTTYLSDLQPTSQKNAVGPLERDRHNGGAAAGDGGPIVLGGRTYAKGLGTNAFADVRYDLGGRYTSFTVDVGIDDSCGDGGSAVAEIHTEKGAVKVTPVLRGSSATQTLTVNVTGRSTLRLVVGAAGDGNACDRFDWAGARLTGSTSTSTTTAATTSPTSSPTTTTKPPTSSTTATTKPPTSTTTTPPTGTAYLSSLTPLSAKNGLGPVERDRHNGGSAAGDGGPIMLNGRSYTRGLGTHAFADVKYNLAGLYTTFIVDVGIDDSCGSAGSAIAEVHTEKGAVKVTPVLRGSSATQTLTVNVTGRSTLRLVVGAAGDGNACDRFDWADARLVR